MLTVAVTGGIGSGKSTASGALADHGAVVIDSDRLAREVVAVGTPGLAAIAERFGSGVISADGLLNRPGLASIVFSDPAARRDLEAITHPAVRRRFVELAAAAPADAIVVNDIPLLTSLDVAARFHLVIGVGAEAETRVRRLVGRGLSAADARARIAAQIDDASRRPLTDVWLDNNGAPVALAGQIDRLWTERLSPFNANLLAGVRADRDGPKIVDADPEWPLMASRLLARVSRAVGDAALSLEHIGSTAVPGLAAKDVIDLQLGVASLSVAEGLSDVLRAAGFVRPAGDRWDNPHPASPGGQRLPKVFAAGTDPGRAVNLHIRVAGGPAWTFALAFRDWLRSDGAARAEYVQLMRSLAARFTTDVDGYTTAKEAWFTVAHHWVQDWVAGSGWQPPGWGG